MAKKSVDMAVFQNWINTISNLLTAIKKLGGTADAFKNFNKQEVIDAVAELLVGKTDDLKLKFLMVIKESISITTSAFSKSLFTTSTNPKYYIWENFQKWILNKASDFIPEFKGTVKSLKLTKSMKDSEILAEIGESNIFSIDEACAIFKALTERQPNGEAGDLINNGYANIIYVRLDEKTVVPARVRWNFDNREWRLIARSFDDYSWFAVHSVLVRG
ncbi:MAG: hypothetical protein LiPW41_280 [Parcubacteria group bacterium LiPW_41]|nr:MAG: hypothetical protein LiPW41_280 [Parcubacteria group bacterium LiPW_41]